MIARLALVALLLLPVAAGGEILLPPGFTTEVYVTGHGFDASGDRAVQGIPAIGTAGIDGAGTLYLARTGARFRTGDIEDLWPIYRIPIGGGRLTQDSEPRFLHGPPLPNPQIGAVTPGGVVWVTTYDRDRRLGALYRYVDGRPTLFAGGRSPGSEAPLLHHPEGVALDAQGRVYVADREQGVVVRLSPEGAVLDPAFARITRPRMLAFDEAGYLWVAGDGTAETPFGAGLGELWRVAPDGTARLVLQGPLAAGLAVRPNGAVFVAQRRTGQVFAVTEAGRRIDLVTMKSGSFLRGLAFAPATPVTRQAGIAGDLFLLVVPRSMWLINQVVRVSGPFDDWLRQQRAEP
jgi:hypothetical protein